jgi:tetratricopeptide (TPR) repeat protein
VVLGLAQRSWVRTPDWRSDIALFERDLEHDPRFREGYYVLASALVRDERLEEARGRLEELRAVGARFAGLSSFLRVEDAFNLYCRVNLNLGRGPDTLPLFGDELRADSNDLPLMPHVYLCGARTLEEVGRVDEALAIFLRLRDLNPAAPDPTATVGIARCHARMARYPEAREWLGRVPPAALGESHLFGEVMDVRARIRRGDPDAGLEPQLRALSHHDTPAVQRPICPPRPRAGAAADGNPSAHGSPAFASRREPEDLGPL